MSTEETAERSVSQRGWVSTAFMLMIFSGLVAYGVLSTSRRNPFRERSSSHHHMGIRIKNEITSISQFPPVLLETVYNRSTDFNNTRGISPPFWTKREQLNTKTWGPCYPLDDEKSKKINWKREIQKRQKHHKLDYHDTPGVAVLTKELSLAGYCRPGFLIIGAGKCGTSSLYHYLVGHPRVLPANQKQIHYFKYYSRFNMQWYLAHFPSMKSFLSAGALMTGEASPGYLPYPDVAHLTAQRLPGPKIIAIGREPLDRAWSSYRYSYVTPALKKLRKGGHKGAKRGQSDEYYQQFLFSFEDMVRVELETLKECLKPGGAAEMGARKDFEKKLWAQAEFARREAEGLPPLVDMDKHCYGKKVNRQIPRQQWADLIAQYPEKVIDLPNLQLVEATVGRSLYTLPLEWWYANFPSQDFYFMCTEELRDTTGTPLNELGQFLGLPSFDFSDIVQGGAYNVGSNQGYDMETSWNKVDEAQKTHETWESKIPLSDELREEFYNFVHPYNERLFKLVGRRCNW